MNDRDVILALLLVFFPTTIHVTATERIDFQRDVAPILQSRCVRCHNDRERRGGLSLQSAAAANRGGSSGKVIEPGDVESSYLLQSLLPGDGAAEMPKGEPPLDDNQIDTIRRWIDGGAVWPSAVKLKQPVPWALQPIAPGQPPALPNNRDFPIRNPIDAFVASKHQAAGVKAAPPADARTLVRRLFLDITGLPPTPDEIERWAADSSPDAYGRLVDRLLESPHFGERWGRHWLDLARYADSEGYLGDSERPHAWVYREWVIDSINRDLPFDQFTIQQLAGDLVASPSLDQRIATGFHRNTLRNTEAGVDLELYRTKEIVDRVNTTGMVWLGLTLGCAECHDHKHDPITQTEFYEMYAFFNNADEVGVPVTQPWEVAEHQRAVRDWRTVSGELLEQLSAFQKESLNGQQKKAAADALSTAASSGKPIDWKTIVDAYATDKQGWEQATARLDAHLKNKPAKPSTKARAFADRKKDRRESFVHVRGVYTNRGETVEPDTPAALPPLAARGEVPDRLDLARWLFDESNPLTARVAANRIWQQLFGQGLVATPNDFGNQGARPTHRELLDWLAAEYRRLGWSRKAMIRRIVMSSTYRLSSAANAVPSQEHVGNQTLWRQNSFRVSAEAVRDLHLAASGLLDQTVGRRGIRPSLPAFVTEVGRSVKWPVSQGGERYRRGLYIFFKRTVPYPMLMTFDAPDSTASCGRRERSNTPLQALTLLNDPVFYECAQALGRQIAKEHPHDTTAAINDIYLRCLGRRPNERERSVLTAAFHDVVRANATEAEANEPNRVAADAGLAGLIAVARIVMNLDEFVTRD